MVRGIERLRGFWNIVPTPFQENGDLDEASIATLVDFVVGCGVDGMTILGVMGEAAKLSDAERSAGIAPPPGVAPPPPASSGVWMSAEFLASLAGESTKCRVVKLEEEPSPPKIRRLLAANPELTALRGPRGRTLR